MALVSGSQRTAVYMPILKWKQGELQALDNLSAPARTLTIPMLDIVEDSIDVDAEMLTTPRFQRTASRLAKAWPSGPIFVDADEFDALIGRERFGPGTKR